MPNFLIWILIFILVGCSDNYLNLKKNFQLLQLLKMADYSLGTQEIQIGEFVDCLSHFQNLFPGSTKILIAKVYSEYMAILKNNGEKKLLTMRAVRKHLNLSSFHLDPRLKTALKNKISSLHYLLYPKEGFFSTRGVAFFVLKSHLYLRQMGFTKKESKLDWGIFSTIDSLHMFLRGFPGRSHEQRMLLEISHSIMKDHPISERFGEVVEDKEKSLIDVRKIKNHKFLGGKTARPKNTQQK